MKTTADVATSAALIVEALLAYAGLANGTEIGFEQLSELIPVKGVDLHDRIPEAVQMVTLPSGAIAVSANQIDAAVSARA